MKHDIANGKYTIINDNGRLSALRHGEYWNRDLCGDNLIYWMLVDFDKMKEQRDELLDTLQRVLKDIPTVVRNEGMGYIEEAILKVQGAKNEP